MTLWPRWVVTPLFMLDTFGAAVCLGLLVVGLLNLAKPDTGRPRSYGLVLIGVGLVWLTPLLLTVMFADRLPLDF